MPEVINKVGSLMIGQSFVFGENKFRVSGFKNRRTVEGINVGPEPRTVKTITVDISKIKRS